MGLRIKEHQHRRKLETERSRQEILEIEAKKFQELAWSTQAADQEFITKLAKIRELITSPESATDLAKKLEEEILEKTGASVHKDLLAGLVRDLL